MGKPSLNKAMKKCILLTTILALILHPLSRAADDAAKADPNVYYLLTRISITMDSGIISLPPGTKLHRVADVAGGIKAKTDDGTVVEVKDSQVTQEPDHAAKLAQEDADKKAAIEAQVSAAQQAAAQKAQQEAAARQQALDAIAAGAASPTPPPSLAPLTGAGLDNPPVATFKMASPPPKKKK
jgi:hypothetical protein